MTFSVYVPPHAEGAKLPVVWFLSRLSCTHAKVTEKGEFRAAYAELGLILVASLLFEDRRHLLANHAGRRRFIIVEHYDELDRNALQSEDVRAFTQNGQRP